MGKPQKILTTVLWGFAVFGMFLFLALSSAKKKEAEPIVALAASADKDLPVLFDLPKFKLLDQDGHDFTDDQLRGKPFVANFVQLSERLLGRPCLSRQSKRGRCEEYRHG